MVFAPVGEGWAELECEPEPEPEAPKITVVVEAQKPKPIVNGKAPVVEQLHIEQVPKTGVPLKKRKAPFARFTAYVSAFLGL